MMRFIMPIILIGISVSVFFMFSSPIYNDIGGLRAQTASYDEALKNSKTLEQERDKLTAKKNSFDLEYLARLQKLLPNNIDNIRLILEIEQVASPYGMVLRDVKYNATAEENTTKGVATPTIAKVGSVAQSANTDYGVWDLEFSTVGTYNNFLNFTRDLEKNLRIVDISSIQFSSTAVGGRSASNLPEAYRYDFKIKTYWLKK